jgi:DEAD/DEAH box helicase domain-containing protein
VEDYYFSTMMETLASRAGNSTLSWLGFANLSLRRHLLDLFSRPYGATGSFIGDPAFEAVFGWHLAKQTMAELAGNLLHPVLVEAMNSPEPSLASEYRFPSDRQPYAHQLEAWKILGSETKNSLVVTSGTGSGKTECFLVPILDRLFREYRLTRGPLVGVRALFLYPLNALINSQRDRLQAWTYGLNDAIRFCLYNGVTPEHLPPHQAIAGSEICDRKTLRKLAPPILVTNATMLEYMLVRTQDRPILDSSQGKLEWIILDEAHTYIGSQAAELALLIRRVLHEFGVKSKDVRFVATSATIGDPNGSAGTQLREFLARVSGTDIAQVHLVSGDRAIPRLPVISESTSASLDYLRTLGNSGTLSASRYAALVQDPTARKLRDIFISKKPYVAKLSQVCGELHGPSAAHSRPAQDEALKWLDVLTSAIDVDGTPFLPLRGHIFHQTLPGLWCCADPRCIEKQGSRLNSIDWPFGTLFLEPREVCKCGSPAFQLIACNDCGAIYLHAEVSGNRIGPPLDSTAIDEFALENERVEDEGDGEPSFGREDKRYPVLIANRNLPDSGIEHIRKSDGTFVERSDAESVSLVLRELGPEGLVCPECGKSSARFDDLFRTARVGAPFYLGGVLPTLLEFAPDGDHPADKTSRGRRLLTFTDSRQGTARLAARLQQDAERSKTRGLIYHNLLAHPKPEGPIQDQITELEKIGEQSTAIRNLLEQLRQTLFQGSAVPFRQLQLALQQGGVEFKAIQSQYEQYSRELFGGSHGTPNVAEVLLLREMGRRPKRQNNLESMGLVAVVYPRLATFRNSPAAWKAIRRSDEEWRSLLKIALDHFVRGGASLEIRDELWPWLGLRGRSRIVSATTDEISRSQRRWPTARRSGERSTLVRMLAQLLGADIKTAEGVDLVDSLLLDAWNEVRKLLKATADGYVLPLEEMSYQLIREAWVCPFTWRLLDATLGGVSPYQPRRLVRTQPRCEHVDIPVYDQPFGGAADGHDPVRTGRRWLASQPQVQILREEGLWSSFHDRVIEFAMYFTSAEHSAQQPSARLREYEKKFKDGRVNVLSCSTTMEMGIDIGGIQQAAMNNVPPHPANYLQRAGRAGRRQETRSTALTLCKANPHDQNVFLNSRWAFDTVLPGPVVSLNSALIVQRHVNAVALSYFLKGLSKQDAHKLTCGWFFIAGSSATPAEHFLLWSRSYVDGTGQEIEGAMQELTRHTIFENRTAGHLLSESGAEMERISAKWLIEWNALADEEKRIASDPSQPAAKAIAFQKKRLANEYLLRELATSGFLPGYGFPTHVVSFDNLTISGLRNTLSPPSNGFGDQNRYQRRELASRDVVTALREYSPGAEVIIDGLVYRSAGITLNWHVPASEAEVHEAQAIRFAWRCSQCGASGTSVIRTRLCDACGAAIINRTEFLEPAGFAVDFYENPHNDISQPLYVPFERPWVSARGEWSPLPNPDLGSYRQTSEGRVFHRSSGENGSGYAICLACGRAEPLKSDRELPEIFLKQHYRLRGKSTERVCAGSTNQWAIKRLSLGHELQTDMLEIQLRDVNGSLIQDDTTALTLAVVLRNALAALLGVQASELGCDAREMLAIDGVTCRSIFIFDRFSAGYASTAHRFLTQMFQKAVELLSCPRHCDSCCPNCILDFDQRFEADRLDRHSALNFLCPDWLNNLKLPINFQYFGESSRTENATLIEAVLRECERVDVTAVRLYAGGDPSKWDFASSTLRSLAYKLLAIARHVVVVIPKGLLQLLPDCDRHSMAALADHPGASVRVVESIPTAGCAVLLAEVAFAEQSVAWANSDTSVAAANAEWGRNVESPLIVGARTNQDAGGLCTASSLRPLQPQAGGLDISVQHQLDGDLSAFGSRFWSLITQEHDAFRNIMSAQESRLISISYSDRYLFNPIAVANLYQILASFKNALGAKRFGQPRVSVITTAMRPDGHRTYGSRVYSDWPDTKMRDEVAALVFGQLGTVTFTSSGIASHVRSLEVTFSDGHVFTLRLDQGVGYWRVASGTKVGEKNTWFDFENLSIQAQAKLIMGLQVRIGGHTAPTYIFAKLRQVNARDRAKPQ